jgi:hypothetical protein
MAGCGQLPCPGVGFTTVEVWEQINATLSILAWPVVVGLATMVVFREQVASLLNRIIKGKIGSAEIVLVEANQEIREITVSDTATGLDTADREVAGEPSDRAGPGDADETREPRFTREQVEKFLEIAAEAGYKVASLEGYTDKFEPHVVWTEDGTPQYVSYEDTRKMAEERKRRTGTYLPRPLRGTDGRYY